MPVINDTSESTINITAQLDADFQHTSYWRIIHDLTLNYQGSVAHIDHLIISRTLDFWICASKDLGIDTQMPESQIRFATQQALQHNIRNINVLYKLIIDNELTLPTKLGIPIPPSYNNLILVSAATNAHLANVKHLAVRTVISNTKVFKTITNKFNTENPLKLLRLISMQKLDSLVEQLKTK